MGRCTAAAAAALALALAAAATPRAAAYPSYAGCRHPTSSRGPHKGTPVNNDAIAFVVRDGDGNDVSELAPGGSYTVAVSGDVPRAMLLTEQGIDLCQAVSSRKSTHEVDFTAPLDGQVSFKVRMRVCKAQRERESEKQRQGRGGRGLPVCVL